MQEYPKVQSLYKRALDGTMLFGQWSTPELEWLSGCEWLWTEKVDGTNIRAGWDPDETNTACIRFGGRTNQAQIPPMLLEALTALLDPADFVRAGLDRRTTLYGEGYGVGIQKGGGDYGPPSFILFDVAIGGGWLSMGDVQSVAHKLGVASVPVIGAGTLAEMEAAVRAGLGSELYTTGRAAEGLVARARPGVLDRRGRPIMAKIKSRDFIDRSAVLK